MKDVHVVLSGFGIHQKKLNIDWLFKCILTILSKCVAKSHYLFSEIKLQFKESS